MFKRLPHVQLRNIALFYSFGVTFNGSYIVGNWIFFWLRYMDYRQIGLVDALLFGFGLVMEVPTGVVGDLVGRRRTLILAFGLAAAGVYVMAAATSLYTIVIGFAVWQIGNAFFSGAGEALAYDTLKAAGLENDYDRVAATAATIMLITALITILLGGLLYTLQFRLPHYAWATSYLVGFLMAFLLTEPPLDSTPDFSVRGYTRQLLEGVQQLRLPSIQPLMPIIFAVSGFYVAFAYGLVMPSIAIHFGFNADAQAIIFALLRLPNIVAVMLIPWARRWLSDRNGLVALGVVLTAAYALSALPLGVAGIVVLLLFSMTGVLMTPWISIVVNRDIPSRHRATTLSTIALLSRLPYVLTAVVAGALIEDGLLWLFVGGCALFIFSVTVWTALRVPSLPPHRPPTDPASATSAV